MKRTLRRRDFLRGGLLTASGLAAPGIALALTRTPHQVIGPFYPLPAQRGSESDADLVRGPDGEARGTRIRIHGRVLDREGNPVAGARVEVWHADANGRYRHPADRNPEPRDPFFQGYGRVVTDAGGRYRFRTIRPRGYLMDRFNQRAPHVHFRVTGPGLVTLGTQMYFAGEPLNEQDLVLHQIPDPDERARLVVAFRAPEEAEAGPAEPEGRFDLIL